ncbi:MAG: DEAD/DEAH box helicase family protein [Oscillospiraceae bacterium]|nr:DEAD/DEAH box helicase family protein [Oscillospiraceae bacterium]
MPTNFDFLKNDPQFACFADAAVQAELVLPISPRLSATGCRTAMEFAIKWIYSVDESLKASNNMQLQSLMAYSCFRNLIPPELFKKIESIKKIGNNAAHRQYEIDKDRALLALEYLHCFLKFVGFCYGSEYYDADFDRGLLSQKPEMIIAEDIKQYKNAETKLDFEDLLNENKPNRKSMTKHRIKQEEKGYNVKPIDFTEAQTREVYIDLMLEDAGWVRGENWKDEYPIEEMPNKSGDGSADYVLFGDDGIPLAVIEAKRTSVSVVKGRQKAVLYADFLENKFGRRPIIFMTNGYETRMWNDKYYPERQVSEVFSKRDLEKEFNLMKSRKSLIGVQIKDEITDRSYQKNAIQAICDTFYQDNRRKALLVMATGSGKTRVVISLVDVLERYGWIKNVLFLADRKALVRQGKNKFYSHMQNLSLCNLVENKKNASARVVFSTYQTMSNCIDDIRVESGGRLFSPGHFDLIIVDEAHRSIYNKHKDIFTYFDALLVGLTATPIKYVDRNTYEIFDLDDGDPTFGYELEEAVDEGHLVSYVSIETELKFPFEGIHYNKLPENEKEDYENTFADEDGDIPESIDASAINDWLFNHDTIKKALHLLMENGQRIDYGTNIGKTIIFAKNHKHAEKIFDIWNKEYPSFPPHYCRVIDYQVDYADDIIEDFYKPDDNPRIAISVDMLDTGIDVPEILNLVFFKRVFSQAKFWQMIGRGTRTCLGLIDGEDKARFYIFDFGNNFEFFRVNPRGKEAETSISLHKRLFNIKFEIIYRLQDISFQTDELKTFREKLVNEILYEIRKLNRDNYAVKQHLAVIDNYQVESDFAAITRENTLQVADHVIPYILPPKDDTAAIRFDVLLYQIILALITSKPFKKAKNDLYRKTEELSRFAINPDILAEKELIEQILHGDYLERAGMLDFDEIRIKFRNLIKSIPLEERRTYDTNFTDEILSIKWNETQLESDTLANYKERVSYFIKQHKDIPAIAKLYSNIPMTSDDIAALEHILWNELGTREQYEEHYTNKPLGELVRNIIGLSPKAANEAFSSFLNDAGLDSRQMYFVNQIVRYIVKNGMMTEISVLKESPFSDMGSLSEIFDEVMFVDIQAVIDLINRNAVAV